MSVQRHLFLVPYSLRLFGAYSIEWEGLRACRRIDLEHRPGARIHNASKEVLQKDHATKPTNRCRAACVSGLVARNTNRSTRSLDERHQAVFGVITSSAQKTSFGFSSQDSTRSRLFKLCPRIDLGYMEVCAWERVSYLCGCTHSSRGRFKCGLFD